MDTGARVLNRHKRGDTFELLGVMSATINGVPQLDLTGWGGASQVRGAVTKGLVAELVFTWIDITAGTYKVRASDTSGWPLGPVLFDVQISDGSTTISTETSRIHIVEDATYD